SSLSHAQPIVLRELIDLHHDLLDCGAWRLATTDRLHPDESGCLQLCQRACEIWLRTPCQLRQLGDRSGLAIANESKQLTIFGRQQPDQSINRIEARFGCVGGSRTLAASDS